MTDTENAPHISVGDIDCNNNGEYSGTKVVTILTKMPISFNEVSFLRGAAINMVGDTDVLFHDHNDTGFRYSYPLIQYKIINGNAAIVAIDRGAEIINRILPFMNSEIRIGQRSSVFTLENVITDYSSVAISEEMHSYMIHRWLPLNQSNYSEYKNLDHLDLRVEMLERLMVGNILSCAKGLGIFISGTIRVDIIDIRTIRQYQYKNVQMLGFDVTFRTNVLLPDNIGLGKGVSLGFGTLNAKNNI